MAWRGGLFFKDGEIGELSVSSLFLDAGGSVCGCMYVYTHTRTHTARGVLGCETRGRDESTGGPNNPNGLNLGMYVFVYMYTCVYICWEAG